MVLSFPTELYFEGNKNIFEKTNKPSRSHTDFVNTTSLSQKNKLLKLFKDYFLNYTKTDK